MNRISSIKPNSIAENCRTILRGYSSDAQTPCHVIPTNPLCSPYGIDTCQMPVVCCEKLSHGNTLFGLSPGKSFNYFSRQPNCTDGTFTNQIPTDSCIRMITNAIISKIRYKIPQEEIALLCCCLPSLIRQIMCKSPWLTSSDIIQQLSTDIIIEAKDSFNQVDLNKQKLSSQRKGNKSDDNISYQNDNDTSPSHRNVSDVNSQDSIPSQHSSRSGFDSSNKKKNPKKIKNRTSSTNSTKFSPSDNENEGDQDEKSGLSRDKDSNYSMNTFDSNEYFQSNPKQKKSDKRSPRNHIEFPGKKDPNAIQDVEKCLAFYHKIREYFDDDVSAMLLKCCLCYGDCSGKK